MSILYTPYYPGAQHMVGNDTFEPQRTNNFEIRFEGLDSIRSAESKYGANDGIPFSDAGKKLTLSVSDVGDLSQNVDAIAVNYGNNAIKFAGKPTLNDISITLNDFIGIETERILEAWSAKVYNKKTQLVGRASEYKKRAYLFEYSPDYTICKAWQLEGCWPGTISYGGFSQDGGNTRKITMTLNVDFAITLDEEDITLALYDGTN